MIETERLILRPIQPEDLDRLLSIFADPKVMAAFGEAPFDRSQMAAWMQNHLDHEAGHGYGALAVVLKANGDLIGDCALERMELDGVSCVELGYDFRSDYWRQGLATEAAKAVLDYALGMLRLPRLVSLIRVGNDASRRVAERIGMVFSGEIQRHGRRYWLYAAPVEPGTLQHPRATPQKFVPTQPDRDRATPYMRGAGPPVRGRLGPRAGGMGSAGRPAAAEPP